MSNSMTPFQISGDVHKFSKPKALPEFAFPNSFVLLSNSAFSFFPSSQIAICVRITSEQYIVLAAIDPAGRAIVLCVAVVAGILTARFGS